MTDSPESAQQAPASTPPSTPPSGRRKPGLEGMLLPELKQVASTMGLRVSGMRKGQVIEAIQAAQSQGRSNGQSSNGQSGGQSKDQGSSRPAEQPTPEQPEDRRDDAQPDRPRRERPQRDQPEPSQPDRQQERQADREKQDREKQDRDEQQDGQRDRGRQDDAQQSGPSGQQDDEQGGSRRNRRRRGRDRNQDQQDNRQQDNQRDTRPQEGNQRDNRQQEARQPEQRESRQQDTSSRETQRSQRNQGSRRGEPDLQILEDDVLAPCAGILDLLDNYAFVRTSGYLPGVDDVYVSMSMVRKHGLRRGDAVAGQVRQPREGERREKFNPLVRIDTVNGTDPEIARNRVDFAKLTPLYPTERLRLETSSHELVGRTLDLLTPLGKGQRGLVISPAKGGKTTVLQAIAGAVTTNNPECHVMVVLVDERPEEVTDYQRSIKGEVISSTFDRPPADHTLVAELALERAKRLVELGHDVVVLLDGLTRLARAYNAAAPSSSRNLAGGLDPAALHQSKKFFGAARNVENGGSLSIVATASSGSSPTDTAILEEFEGTENMELRLRRELAEPEVFPAVDVPTSGTRHEELLLSDGELAAARALRRSLGTLERTEASVRLAEQLRGSGTNLELLRRTTPSR